MLRRQEVARARPRRRCARSVFISTLAVVVAWRSWARDYLAPYRSGGARSCCAWWPALGPSASRPWPAWPGRAGRALPHREGPAVIGAAALAGALAGLGVWLVVTGCGRSPSRWPPRSGRFEPRAPVADADVPAELGQPGRAAACAMCRRWRASWAGRGPTCASWAAGPRTTRARPRSTACSASCSARGSGWSVWVAGAPFPASIAAPCRCTAGATGLSSPVHAAGQGPARRAGFLHALIAYCHVTAMSLAAGRGVEQALTTAASAGEGWAFTEMRAALNAGYVRGETPESLGRLGADLGAADLSSWPPPSPWPARTAPPSARRSPPRPARSATASAPTPSRPPSAATAQMGLPAVAIAAGFLVFLMYPALSALGSALLTPDRSRGHPMTPSCTLVADAPGPGRGGWPTPPETTAARSTPTSPGPA